MAYGESYEMVNPVGHPRPYRPCQRCTPIVANDVYVLNTEMVHHP